MNGQISIKNYVIEPAKVLVVVDDGADLPKVQQFLLSQPEVLEVEVDNKKYTPTPKGSGTPKGKKGAKKDTKGKKAKSEL